MSSPEKRLNSSSAPWDRLQAAVAPAAFHNAAERFDPPRCHPNTRVGVMDELRELAQRSGDTGDARILWLHGPAGAGKSAIAQSFCEECFSEKSLLASFFFNRSDASRNNAKSFVATLTYQVYGEVPARNQSLILAVIENDPLVFERSIDAQFTALIMNPLRDLIEGGYFVNNAPFVIVVDGLDECATAAVQVSILTALQKISKLPQSPFVFVVTSRPEHDIQMFFRSFAGSLGRFLRQLRLDDSYNPDADIELFLRAKIQELRAINPHKDSIPQDWPSNEAIKNLVSKSSGHFIYPSVVIKYIASSRHYPPNRLDIVLGLRPPKNGHPLVELDALYSHIFSRVEDVTLVLQILRIVLLFQDGEIDLFAQDVDQLCDMDQGKCLNALCDLQSVVQIGLPNQAIRILHKSLSDYLTNPSRSHEYYIDTSPNRVTCTLTQCLRVISDPNLDYNPRYSDFITYHRQLLVSNIQICHENLMSFSLVNCQKTSHVFASLFFSFGILDILCTLEGTDYEYVYRHHLQQFPELVHQYPEADGSQITAIPYDVFSMIALVILLGDSELHIPAEVFSILQRSSHSLADYPHMWLAMGHWNNLTYAVAKRCINSLIHDNYSITAAFALECLPLALSQCKITSDLYEACYILSNLLAYSSLGRSLVYDTRGRSYARMGYSVADMFKITKELEHNACRSIWFYTATYARNHLSGRN